MTPALAAALAAPGQPETGFQALELAMASAIGFRLFTIMRHDGTFKRRVHSSNPGVYPVGGAKPVLDTPWSRRLRQGLPTITTGEAGLAEGFTDHAIITGLGGACALNLPVFWNGRLIGAVNLLDGPRIYAEADADHAMLFMPFAIPGLLA